MGLEASGFGPAEKWINPLRSRANIFLSRRRNLIIVLTFASILLVGSLAHWHDPQIASKAAEAINAHVLGPAEPVIEYEPEDGTPRPEWVHLDEVAARQPPPPKGFDPVHVTFDVPEGIKFDPKGPRPEQLVLLTAADGKDHGTIDHMLERALQNRQDYCDAQGYTCHWVNVTRMSSRNYRSKKYGPHWKKLPAIIETFQTYPDAHWVWMLDTDAIIMSPEVDIIQKLLNYDSMRKELMNSTEIKRTKYKTAAHMDPKDVDLIIAQDHSSVNSGSFFVRRSEAGRWMMDIWRTDAMRSEHSTSDQNGLINFISQSQILRSHLGMVRLRLIQAWQNGMGKDKGWQEGDVAIHFAGCWVKGHCKEWWNKYWNLRGKAPPRRKKPKQPSPSMDSWVEMLKPSNWGKSHNATTKADAVS